MNILSIQSWVAYGHVGNASAMFPLQRLGAEVWAVHTVQFSNHTGYGAWTGQVFGGDAVRAVVDGIAARGVLPGCDAVLSGYLGDPGVGEAVLDAVARVRAANPLATYCCDPVIGDTGRGVFVRDGIPELIRSRAVPAADILTPNGFELEHLTGQPVHTLPGARAAVAALQAQMAPAGPATVLVTSLRTDETPEDAVDMLAADRTGAWLLRTPLAARPGQRRRGRHRRPVPVPPPPHRARRRRPGRRRQQRPRPAPPHRGGRVARDPHGRRPGRVRRPSRHFTPQSLG